MDTPTKPTGTTGRQNGVIRPKYTPEPKCSPQQRERERKVDEYLKR